MVMGPVADHVTFLCTTASENTPNVNDVIVSDRSELFETFFFFDLDATVCLWVGLFTPDQLLSLKML